MFEPYNDDCLKILTSCYVINNKYILNQNKALRILECMIKLPKYLEYFNTTNTIQQIEFNTFQEYVNFISENPNYLFNIQY